MIDSTQKLHHAVFLDRDGTINVEKNYLYRIEEFEFIQGVPQALKRIQDAGYLLVVVTNQSGVARGYFSLENLQHLHDYMCSKLKYHGVNIDGIYFCPHHPSKGSPPLNIHCDCRKGEPGLLLQASIELGINLSCSYMIGDKVTDIQAGSRAGCRSLLVGNNYEDGYNLPVDMQPEACFESLSGAVDYIIMDAPL